MEITIYTTASCPYCGELKNYLEEKGLQYTEKMVDQDMPAREEMKNHSDGYLGVPFVYIVKDGTEHKVIGFNKNRLDAILNK